MPTSIQQQIENALREALSPEQLTVINESHLHNVPPGSESHFNATIVSASFGELSRPERHRAVYGALGSLMRSIHALTIKTLTPDEWRAVGSHNPSPPCLGGSKRDRAD